MMRELVQSRSAMAVLVGLYVLASLGAIPVPSLVLSRAPSIDEVHASYCSCVSCSPESCCCAMLAPDDDEGPVSMLGYSCQPTVTWFLAVLPPVTPGIAAGVRADVVHGSGTVPVLVAGVDRSIGVPSPPPKPAA